MSAANSYGPGQVAMITIDGAEHIALRDSNDAWLVGDIEDLRVVYDLDELVTGIYPLYVLDVRNERKVKVLEDAIAKHDSLTGAVISVTQRPAEPTGFGAVVLDVEKRRWLRDGMEADGGPWFYGPGPRGEGWIRREYSEISVVEVLQMGVPA